MHQLNVFIRQSQKVAMANIAQAVNVIAPISEPSLPVALTQALTLTARRVQ